MLYETALNNFTTDRKFADSCEEIAEHRLATWVSLVPTADVVDRTECSKCVFYPFKQLREQLADVCEVKKGEWIKENIVLTSNPPQYRWHCSNCKEIIFGFTDDVLTNYCPNCGADMMGEDNE